MKTDELRDMTQLELEKELEDKKEALFNLRFQKAKKTLDNTHSIRYIRRDIARINTILREKKEV
jgi:large subunit ribosomal protein L29